MSPMLEVLRLIPEANPQLVETSCCGMAGAFGYDRDTYGISVQMAELDLMPTLRRSDEQTIVVADGFSCRHQIKDLSGRKARHAIRILRDALGDA
jgi:Fe-S oxidoreductase